MITGKKKEVSASRRTGVLTLTPPRLACAPMVVMWLAIAVATLWVVSVGGHVNVPPRSAGGFRPPVLRGARRVIAYRRSVRGTAQPR